MKCETTVGLCHYRLANSLRNRYLSIDPLSRAEIDIQQRGIPDQVHAVQRFDSTPERTQRNRGNVGIQVDNIQDIGSLLYRWSEGRIHEHPTVYIRHAVDLDRRK